MVTDYKSILRGDTMNAIGIDVSKGKSKIAIIRPFGEIIMKPFDIAHHPDQFEELA